MGKSGCGKSVLIKHIIGLLTPDKGNVLIDGVDITTLDVTELDQDKGKTRCALSGWRSL